VGGVEVEVRGGCECTLSPCLKGARKRMQVGVELGGGGNSQTDILQEAKFGASQGGILQM